ncbi:hypothetical protein WN943_029362 [Citrus x changshan-huyou]
MIEKVKAGTSARSESNGGSGVLQRAAMVPDRASTAVKLQRLIGDKSATLFDVDAALRKLLEKKKNLIKETDKYGWTPIHYAVYYGNYGTVNLLLETDQSASNIADKDRKMTALHLAADRGYVGIVKAIISKNLECYELVDNRGWNFLHYAMVSFYVEELGNLLENNPLVRSLIIEGDVKGNTPLHVLAAVRPDEFDVRMIRKMQANFDAVNKQNVSVTNILLNGYPELKEEIQKLSKDVGRGQYSDGVIRGPKYLVGQNDDTKDDYKDTRASHLVVAALIATVAFAAAFTIPGGYRSENGTAILRRNTAFQAFIVADSIAMVFSLSAVFTHFLMALKIEATKDFDEALFAASIWFTLFSMGAMAHDGLGSVQPVHTWKGFYEIRLEPGLVQVQPIFHPLLVPPLNRKESQLRISLIICYLLNSVEICVNQKQNRLWIPKDCAKHAREPIHGPKGDFWTMIKRARQNANSYQ